MKRRKGIAILIVLAVAALVGAMIIATFQSLPARAQTAQQTHTRLQAQLLRQIAIDRATREWLAGNGPTRTWELPPGTFPGRPWNARVDVEVFRVGDQRRCRIRVVLREGEVSLVTRQHTYPLPSRDPPRGVGD